MTSNELPPLINKRRVGAPRTSLFSALASLECMHSSLASATITDGVLTEEDVLRRSRAASLDTVRQLTIYGAGSEHRTSPEDRPSCTACHSLSPSDGLCTPPLLPCLAVRDVSIVSRLTRCEMLSLVGNQVVTTDPATGFAPTRGVAAHRVNTACTPAGRS